MGWRDLLVQAKRVAMQQPCCLLAGEILLRRATAGEEMQVFLVAEYPEFLACQFSIPPNLVLPFSLVAADPGR